MLAVQLRDLDQTVIGNPAHDIIRLALSLAMAARSADLPGVATALMLERIMEGYALAFSGPAVVDNEADIVTVPKTIRLLMRRAAGDPGRTFLIRVCLLHTEYCRSESGFGPLRRTNA